MIGVSVSFKYDEDFDRARVVAIAGNARGTFEGMRGLRSKVFTVDDARQRATNFYVWESADAARSFFSEEMRERVTALYASNPRSSSWRSLSSSTTPAPHIKSDAAPRVHHAEG